MKASNIQLGGQPPVVSYQCLVVYSGPGGDNTDEAIYESYDVVEEKKADVKTEVKSDGTSDESTGMHTARCMMPQSHPYKCSQTARRGHVKTPMTRLNFPCDLGILRVMMLPKKLKRPKNRSMCQI